MFKDLGCEVAGVPEASLGGNESGVLMGAGDVADESVCDECAAAGVLGMECTNSDGSGMLDGIVRGKSLPMSS